MMVVTVLLFTEMKHTFTELVQRMQNDEMITLAKFLAISGGKYKTDVVVELPKAGVLSTIINQIKSDDKLKGLFEESQFKQAF
jgi:redox-regulated HSP33 family molecular chaperone